MLADECPQYEMRSPQHYGGSPVVLHLYVQDVDAFVKQAAEAGDTQALSAYVDYPAVRADVRRQVRERYAGGGSLQSRLLRGVVAEGVVETLVRPAMRAEDLAMRRDGLDQFRLANRNGGGAELVFRRAGLGWRLAGVRLPKELELPGQ